MATILTVVIRKIKTKRIILPISSYSNVKYSRSYPKNRIHRKSKNGYIYIYVCKPKFFENRGFQGYKSSSIKSFHYRYLASVATTLSFAFTFSIGI